ncbi:AbrB/MazE/SpoVT family DNA-binding domain-containing protein [Candidatus Micrarchaeota archaeon]|nr:AbrB/MazE/SpoVT family DNA-binding domain-containing protein [Candidatus Micrarchaeota archaeon]
MRFFKHGSVLAISLPESLRQKLGITENDEYDFVETQPGILTLVRKGSSVSAEKVRQAVATPATGTASKPVSTPHPPFTPMPSVTSSQTASKPAGPSSVYGSTGTALDRQGFLVLSSEDEAKGFSFRFEGLIKSGEIKGIRGFDKKFYLAARGYSETYADRILVGLKEPKTASDLSALVKQPLEGVLTLLYLLKEEGEVIEKKRGLFVRVL